MEGMILDLRGNGGGYLEEASKFLGHFLPKGEPTVQSEYQAYESMTFKSDGKGELANLPTVILIDQLTASAGEIIALTLQEQGVPLIGMPSFGKGSIQTFTELPDGSSLKYTVGKRYSPQHVSINGTGVIPNIEIQWDYETYQASGTDNQLEKAKEELLKIISSRPVGQDSNQLSHNRRFLSAHII
jgi:carboxyl-terminal processing protease